MTNNSSAIFYYTCATNLKGKFLCVILLLLVCATPANSASIERLINIDKKYEILSFDIFPSFTTSDMRKGYIDCLHYIKAKQWGKCIKSLKRIKQTDSEYRQDLGNILYGISYHNAGESQLAYNHYKQVSFSSSYYIHAQLYIALLHAHFNQPEKAGRLINKILRSGEDRITPEMLNKLYLIQGHVYFLSKNFSSSREALKKISVNSQYINDATVALALGHIYQGDYEPAKKYLSYLSVKSIKDTPVDTAHILMAFAHSQENSFSKPAIASYKKAITYYKKRVAEVSFLLEKKSDLPIINSPASGRIFIVDNNMLDLSKNLPENFLTNYASLDETLQKMRATGRNNKLYKDTYSLQKKYEQSVLHEVEQRLLIRKDMLSRYLNQCMYTLARLLYQNKLQ